MPRDHAAKLGRTDDHQVAERPLEGLEIVLRGFPSCDAGPRAHARTTRDRGPRFLLTQQSHGVFRWSGWVSRPFAELAELVVALVPAGPERIFSLVVERAGNVSAMPATPRYRPLKTIKIRGNERLSGQT